MNHLTYESFDSTNTDIAFSDANGYTDPASETETRKQLSYPLKEIKDFLHDAISIDDSDNVIQLRVNSGKIQYRTSGNTWVDTDSSGGIPSGGTTGQVLTKNSNTDYDVSWGSEIPDTETIASGDRIVIYDDSGSKMAKSSVQFGSDTTKYLRNDGTWQTIQGASGIIDVSNVLLARVTTTSKTEYTATENCIALIDNANTAFPTLNDVSFSPTANWQGTLILKSGDVLVLPAHGSWQHSLIVFGLR